MADQSKAQQRSDQAEAERKTGARGAGQSGGGAYPNPHDGEDDKAIDTAQEHGGQSEMEYHGTGRLGDKKVGGNANAPASETRPHPAPGRD
jgi:hypothetical protein